MQTGLRTFGLLDWFLFAVLVFSAVRAAMRGAVREIFWLAGSALGLVLACEFYDVPAPLLQSMVHNYELSEALSFLLIVICVMCLAAWVGLLLSRAVRFAGFGWMDSLLGGFFGLIRGVLLISAGIMAAAAFLPSDLPLEKEFSSSALAPYFLQAAHGVSSFVPVEMAQRINSGMALLNRSWPPPQQKQ